jgi:hypothetical protein
MEEDLGKPKKPATSKETEKSAPYFQIIEVSPIMGSTDVLATTDIRYKRVTGVYMYTDGNLTDNVSFEISKPLNIANEEVYPMNFPTGLLFPREDYKPFTEIEAEANGSEISTQFDGDGATTLFIKLRLEN